MAFIEDYGLIGDLQTAALVSRHGCIDWLCVPRFDSGAVFASLLGESENGHWTIQPEGDFSSPGRRYRGDTLVLESDFETDAGLVRLVDFMPPRETRPDLVRIVEGVRGRVEMRMELAIRFDYGSIVPWVRNLDGRPRGDRRTRTPSRCTPPSSSRAATFAPSHRFRSPKATESHSSSRGSRRTSRHPIGSTPRQRSSTRCATGTSGRPGAPTTAAGTTRSAVRSSR